MRALGRISPRTRANARLLAAAMLLLLAISQQVPSARCDTKEFDWSDLGVSLAGPKTSLGASGLGSSSASSSSAAGSANNLRILVSPQRRMTKNYEFEYTNGTNSQPISADTGSYVMQAGAPGATYLSQSALAPNHSGHSSAYSALSASLASLKSRLNARGVSLSSSLADTGSAQSSGLYPNSATYSSSLSGDLSQQQQPSSSSSSSSGSSSSSSSSAAQQPTYLSVSAQQDSQGASAYTVPPGSQESHNKTIVLAIPAKINFLTGAKQQQQQHQQQVQQQQQQQLTVIQSDGQQQTRPEYGTKQLVSVINGQEVVDQSGQLVGNPIEGQEHHQYVIVNSPSQAAADYHSHSVAASLSPSPVGGHGQQIYSSATIYQPASPSTGSYSLKYSPTSYSQQQQQQQQPQLTTYVQQQQQQPLQPTPTVQKYYSMIEQTQPVPQQQLTLASPQQPVYEQATIEQQPPPPPSSNLRSYSYAPASSSSSCLDTCNSADPRWRKYTVSKYKACCSRSSQYDSAFEQPSLDKVSEASSKYSDDAYYGYLYRKSRARRSRRQRARYSQQRYSPQSVAAAASPLGPQTSSADDESASIGDGPSQAEPKATRYQETSSSSSSSGSSSPSSSPYMKYYTRSRYQYSAPAEQAERDVEPLAPPPPPPPAKYLAPKEPRSYRRGRSRELEAHLEPQVSSNGNYNEPADEQDSGPMPASPAAYGRGSSALAASSGGSYGGGDYSVDSGSRYGGGGPASDEESYGNDESIGTELDKSIDSDYASGEPLMEPGADDLSNPEGEQAAVYKYSSGGGSRRRNKQPSKNRRKQMQIKEASTKYYQPSSGGGQSKKGNRNNKAKYGKAETSQTNNGTIDYDSAQAGEYGHGQSSSSSSGDSNDESSYSSSSQSLKNDNNQNSNENLETEKDSVASKYRATSLNETAVANLSKTTMHLKEILSLLEKKAQYGLSSANGAKSSNGNDTNNSNNNALPVTSTPSPLLPITTTMSSLYPMSSLFGGGSGGSSYSSISGSLPTEFLNAELSMKTPYRYEPSLSSSLGSSLSLPSSFGSLGSDSFSSALANYPLGHHPHSSYGLHSGKPLGMPHLPPMPPHNGPPSGPHHPRKRRVNKNSLRYNELMLHKAAQGLGMSPAFLHATAAKNRFLNQAYYQTLQHPYLYRGGSPTVTNPYPYKNIHKNPYSSLFSGPVSSKLVSSAASLYSDESRGGNGGGGGGGGLHGASVNNYPDPLSNVASSLRPSTTMRLRSKPFIFQPQVLPIYSRHTILSQPLDVKA